MAQKDINKVYCKQIEHSIKEVDKPPYLVDRFKLQRFSEKNTVFHRVIWDASWKGYQKMYDEKVLDILSASKPGFSHVDFALAYASWAVYDAFQESSRWNTRKTHRVSVDTIKVDWSKVKTGIEDSNKASLYIKCAAKFFGASLVGICRLNRQWLYAEAEVAKKFKNAIVIAIEMDAEGIATSPAIPAAAATGVGYSKMVFILKCLGKFIYNLGYEAIQCGNDTALSIPLAIDAGLGELGRNGLLITPQYGPRVRLCKIFTDMPLKPDNPIEFGVSKRCKKCKLCAKHCEAEAISMEDEPKFEVSCKSNNPGVLKWHVNAERCYLFWCENGADCSTCIKVCPYNVASARNLSVTPEEFWR